MVWLWFCRAGFTEMFCCDFGTDVFILQLWRGDGLCYVNLMFVSFTEGIEGAGSSNITLVFSRCFGVFGL